MMKKLILLPLFLVALQAEAKDQDAFYEADYVNLYCKGEIEFKLPDKTRIDCLTETHAIEYDYSYKWAEAIGQSLYYSAATGKKAGVVLIINPVHEGRYLKRFKAVVDSMACKPENNPCITIWTVKLRK
jgi:hypothetical protein